jgi:hypothetical protein
MAHALGLISEARLDDLSDRRTMLRDQGIVCASLVPMIVAAWTELD